jgi:hypothetical protein
VRILILLLVDHKKLHDQYKSAELLEYLTLKLEEFIKIPVLDGSVSDILKLIFQLQLHIGALHSENGGIPPTSKEIEQIFKLLPIYKHALEHPQIPFPMKAGVVDCLINVPAAAMNQLFEMGFLPLIADLFIKFNEYGIDKLNK